ncbi:MAG: hypothetical protein VXV86_01215, partial [Verrucomicrobiota bacterium]|nr:hypothetical protein [Verrucomicrobiota bacterium]
DGVAPGVPSSESKRTNGQKRRDRATKIALAQLRDEGATGGPGVASSGPCHLVIEFRLHGKQWVIGSVLGLQLRRRLKLFMRLHRGNRRGHPSEMVGNLTRRNGIRSTKRKLLS